MSHTASRSPRGRQQLTVRFGEDLARRIRELAKAEGLSLNQAAVRLLRRGAGLDASSVVRPKIGHSLDRFIGTWTKADDRAMERAIRDSERIFPEDWE